MKYESNTISSNTPNFAKILMNQYSVIKTIADKNSVLRNKYFEEITLRIKQNSYIYMKLLHPNINYRTSSTSQQQLTGISHVKWRYNEVPEGMF